MSQVSERLQRQLEAFRNTYGELVEFNGVEYRCFVEEVTGAKAGQQGVSQATFGVFVASTAPAIFDFNPRDFAPWTEVQQPGQGDELIRNGLIYVVTSFDFENVDTDTDGFYCYAMRKIWQQTDAE